MPIPRASGPLGILHVVLNLNPGGTQRMVVALATATRHEARVGVCCLDDKGTWAPRLEQAGVPVIALGRHPGFHPAIGRRVAEVARRQGASVLHCHHYTPFVYGQVARLWNPRSRVVYTEHGLLSDAPPSLKRRIANRVLGRLPGRMFAVSSDLRRHLIASGLPATRLGVIRNGIVVGRETLPDDRRRAREILGLSPEGFVAGTIARLDPVKDLGTLVRAFALSSGGGREARLVIIGDGPERRNLEGLVSQQACARNIVLVGEHENAPELLPALDVYVNTSITEGISITILEAMAAGLPVIATEVGGTPEVVVDGGTGLLTPARDPQRVARALAEVAGDLARARQLGEAARERVLRTFNLERMVSDYRRVYRGEQLPEVD